MATGLNFQTQTIINSNVDPDSGNKVLFEAVTTKMDGKDVEALKIKRDFIFAKDCVKSIRMRRGYEAAMCKATINFGDLMTTLLPKSGSNYCRLDIYVEYEGQEPFYGANPTHVRKGIPFWVEFTVSKGDNASKVAENIVNLIKKNHLFLIDKDVIKVKAEGPEVILEGTTEYSRLKNLEIRMFQPYDDDSEKVAELGDAGITLNERGYNSFGTYSQIVKDLRLPTAANYQWSHIRQVETPIVGAVYNEYIIEYAAPACNDGMQAVGQRLESHTTHVFWVKNDTDLIAEWETALSKIHTIEGICCPGHESLEPEIVTPPTPPEP